MSDTSIDTSIRSLPPAAAASSSFATHAVTASVGQNPADADPTDPPGPPPLGSGGAAAPTFLKSPPRGPVRPRLVDAHTHLLPDRLAQAIRGYFVQFITGDFFPYPPQADACRAALMAAGVDRCWSLPYVRRPGSASGLNRWMAERWGQDPVVEPGATVHPGDDVGRVADEALALGLRLFKVHCAVGEFSLGDPRLEPLWDRASAGQIPVVVHLGHSPTGHTEADELPALETVARAWPHAPIILAHLGAPAVPEGLALLRRCPSLLADLTPVVIQTTPVTAADLEGLEERILFGTDLPSVGLRIEEVLGHLRSLGLSPRAERAILAGNADRLVPPR